MTQLTWLRWNSLFRCYWL